MMELVEMMELTTITETITMVMAVMVAAEGMAVMVAMEGMVVVVAVMVMTMMAATTTMTMMMMMTMLMMRMMMMITMVVATVLPKIFEAVANVMLQNDSLRLHQVMTKQLRPKGQTQIKNQIVRQKLDARKIIKRLQEGQCVKSHRVEL